MADKFILALLGHLVGDYITQWKYMALHKSDKNWAGVWICSLHAIIYAAAVCLFWQTYSPVTFLAVCIPHWVIDRWSLANTWLSLIRGRTFQAAHASKDTYREFDIAFTSIVYTVTDNTFHLLSLYLVIIYLL
ncbi:MAG: DUF3307 domain-containing protein [bacterium]|nr:DUF3307 domain-containing protein [bacterium]